MITNYIRQLTAGTPRRVVRTCALLALLPLLTIFAPKSIDDGPLGCRRPLTALGVTITSSCDSRSIAYTGRYPATFVSSPWRSRPGYVFAGAVVAPVMAVVALPLWNDLLADDAVARFDLREFGTLFPLHLGYMAEQWLMLAGMIWLLADLVGRERPLAWIPLSIALLTTELVCAFYLSPHPSLLNLPTIVLMTWLMVNGRRLLAAPPVLSGLALGTTMLFYGAAALLLPAALAGMLVAAGRSGRAAAELAGGWRQSSVQTARWGRNLARCLVFVAGFTLPALAWVLWVKVALGVSVSTELDDHHQFIWVLDFWRQGRLADELSRRWAEHFANILVAADEMLPVLVALLAVTGVSAALAAVVPALRLRAVTVEAEATAARHRVLAASAAAMLLVPLFAAFYLLVGWYDERLASVPVIALVLAGGLAAVAAQTRPALVGLWVAATASLAHALSSAPTF